MSEIKFEEMVAGLVKPGLDIMNNMTPERARCSHGNRRVRRSW